MRRCGRLLALALFAGLAAMARAADLQLAVSEGPVSLPIYVAAAQHYFEREGLVVRTRDCSSGRSCFQLLTEGKVDLATGAELLVTMASFKGSDVAVIATIDTSSNHLKLVARRASGIAVPGDVRGKRVATVTGSSAQYFLDSWLVYHGVDPTTVRVLDLAPERMVEALQRGEVDALAIWEPIASAAFARLAPRAVTLPGARVYLQHFNLMAGRRLIAERGDELVRLLRALGEAERFIAERPAEAERILKSKFPDPPALGGVVEHRYRLGLDQSLVTTMEGQARWLRRQGLVPPHAKAEPLLRHIEPEPLRQAVPGAVTLVR
jgi:NitT/TauT family transport system substrate-binding protein